MKAAGQACNQKNGGFPQLIVAILPDGATDLYVSIKQYVCPLTLFPVTCG